MGYPINHSTVIRLLAGSITPSGEQGEWERQSTGLLQKRVAEYSLYAIIVHDPARHKILDKELTEKFEKFCVKNPTKLVFFTPADPPVDFKQYYLRSGYEYSYPDLFKLISGQSPIYSANSSLL